jgi:hypothetical protein
MTPSGPLPAFGTPSPPTAKVRGPADLAAAVPVLLGFEPRDSVVAVVLDPPVVALTMRVDLPAPRDRWAWKAVGDSLARGAISAGGSAAVVLAYADDRAALDPLRSHVVKSLTRAKVEVLDVLRVHDGRYWSATCRDLRCCPAEGRPVPAGTAVQAAAVVQGVVVRGDRQSLAREFEPPADAEPAAARRAWRTQLDRLLSAGTVDLDDVRALLDTAVEAARSGAVDLETAARLAALLSNGECRDEVYRHLVRRPVREHRALWAAVCRWFTGQPAVVPLAVFALAAYLDGDGATGNLAYERAAALDASHPTVRLVGDILVSAIRPALMIETLARAVGADR